MIITTNHVLLPTVDAPSVGAVMYHILSEQDVLKLNFSFPPLRHYNTKVSEKLDRIILKCLSREAGLRYLSAKELGDALAQKKSIWRRLLGTFQRLHHAFKIADHVILAQDRLLQRLFK